MEAAEAGDFFTAEVELNESLSQNCWLLYAKAGQGSATWFSEVREGDYVLWLHGSDAHMRTMLPGDTAFIFISDGAGSGSVQGVGVIQFTREPFIFDTERQKQRLPVLITHDLKERPLPWSLIAHEVSKGSKRMKQETLSPVKTAGAVHRPETKAVEAISRLMGISLPLEPQSCPFNNRALWDLIEPERFMVFKQYINARRRKDTNFSALEQISSFAEFDQIVGGFERKFARGLSDNPSLKDHLDREPILSCLEGLINRFFESEVDHSQNKNADDATQTTQKPEQLLSKRSSQRLAIGLFGSWGSGKSTIIEILKRRVESKNIAKVIVFNAWRESHSASMSASLCQAIIDELYSTKSFPHSMLFSLKLWWRLHKVNFLTLLVICVLAVVLLAGITAFGQNQPLDPYSLKVVSVTGLTGILIYAVSLVSRSKNVLPILQKASTQPDFGKTIGLGRELKKSVETALRLNGNSNLSFAQHDHNAEAQTTSYIIVIDDLDRCDDNVIFDTLEAAQLLMDMEWVTVIIAVDFRILINAVANRFESQRESCDRDKALWLARDFLGKLFQITVTLGRPTENGLASFIKTRLFADVRPNSEPERQTRGQIGSDDEEIGDINDDEQSTGNEQFTPEETDENIESSAGDVGFVYQEPSHDEYVYFLKCAKLFKITNPRSLIRLFNLISLVKAKRWVVQEEEELLHFAIATAFYWESLLSSELIEVNFKVFTDAPTLINALKRLMVEDDFARLGADTSSVSEVMEDIMLFSLPRVSAQNGNKNSN